MYYYFDYNEPVFRPPAEANSLIFQATIGCSHNRCAFCGMYKMKTFALRPLQDVLAEIESVPENHRDHIKRVFIGDGDGLIYPQTDLVALLEGLSTAFPNLNRVAAYASPNSLTGKTFAELQALHERKLRILYFGLESGDPATLKLVGKGYTAKEMLAQCRKAQDAGMKLSVTAILGLAGRRRSAEHAAATAAWVNALSPRYFSLLTLIRAHNENFIRLIEPLSNGEIIEEALALVRHLQPQGTILRSDHVSNILSLAGTYPKDREKIIAYAEAVLEDGRRHPEWFNRVAENNADFY
ncbi:MAG: radical SAM protein [Deltaproteobacteria bacterium]|nr:radical SAM protein [Deltaproteobacteria bacterium]